MDKKQCSFKTCNRIAKTRGLCDTHDSQNRRGQPLRIPRASPRKTEVSCLFNGCDRWAKKKGLCGTHYDQQLNGIPLREIRPRYPDGLTCVVEYCDRKVVSNFMCKGHAQQFRRVGRVSPFRRVDPTLKRKSQKKSNDKRRAIKRDAFVQDIDRDLILEVSGGVCYLCGWELDIDDWQLEHIIPLSRGGKHAYHNVAASCSPCNLGKSYKDLVQVCTMKF